MSTKVHEFTTEEWCDYLYVEKELSRSRNVDFMRFVLDEAQLGCLERVDDIFKNVDPLRLPVNIIGGMLRSSSMFRNRLQYWINLRDRSVEALVKRNKDVAVLMRGLLDDKPYQSNFPGFQDLLGVHPDLRD